MLLHDWIPVPPFNDVPTLEQVDGNQKRLIGVLINATTVLIPLIYTLKYRNSVPFPTSTAISIMIFYFCLTIGTIASWWIPYFFGSSVKHKIAFSKFKNTHHFLPARGDNVIPNTLHVVLHLLVWSCFIYSIFLI